MGVGIRVGAEAETDGGATAGTGVGAGTETTMGAGGGTTGGEGGGVGFFVVCCMFGPFTLTKMGSGGGGLALVVGLMLY